MVLNVEEEVQFGTTKGTLMEQLSDSHEGLIIFNTDTEEIIKVQKEFFFSK
jgi:hypothetical protein